MATFEIDEKRFEIIKEAVSCMRNSRFGVIENWVHWPDRRSEGWRSVEIEWNAALVGLQMVFSFFVAEFLRVVYVTFFG